MAALFGHGPDMDDLQGAFLDSIGTSSIMVDIAALADACADLAYVVEGTNLEFGINGDEIMAEVHRANMTKAGGGKDEHGKAIKPPGWTPPDIEGVLRKQGWQG